MVLYDPGIGGQKMKRVVRIFIPIMFLVMMTGSCQRKSSPSSYLREEGSVPSQDGVSIHYKVYGAGEYPLFFVHGWCTHMGYWDSQIPAFAVNYKVITIDLAGHGKSGKQRQNWTMEAYGQDITAVANKLNLNNMILIGHSLGGPAILEAARRMPDRVIGLVGTETFSDLYMKSYPEEKIKLSLESLKDNFKAGMRELVLRSYFDTETERKLRAKIMKDMISADPDMALKSLENMLRYDAAASFQAIDCPVRSVNSKMTVESYQTVKENTKSVWIEYVADVGHFIMLEAPLEFNRLLAQFISEFITETYKKNQT